MNRLIVGADKRALLDGLPDRFLFIDDGPLIDQLDLSGMPEHMSVVAFDASLHRFDPLKDMTYTKARDFLAVLDAAFPEGENTLTKRYANFQLLEALLQKPKSLATLIPDTKDTRDAYQKIQTLLLSPVLEPVLEGPTNLSFKGTILARLDRAALGDFDCFVLASLLAMQYLGPVVIPDFGFYACGIYSRHLRQDRLIAGVSSFDEVPAFRSRLLMIEDKQGVRCIPEDAALLATYAGLVKGSNAYNDFIDGCINPRD